MSCSTFTKSGKPRNAGMFKPGVSGNPNGRPKKNLRVTKFARECSPQAVMALFEIMSSPQTKDNERLKAISAILDRAYGKAN